MGPNLNIYGQYLRAPKSVAEFNDEAEARDMNALAKVMRQQQVQAGQMAMQDADAGRQRANQLRALMGAFGQDPDANAMMLTRAGFGKEAADYLKTQLDAQKTRADIGKTGADTVNVGEDARKKRLQFYRDAAETMVRSPDDARMWVSAIYSDPILGETVGGVMPVEQATARIPADPAAFQQWLRQNIMGMDKMLTHDATAARDAEAARRNRATEGLTRRGQDITARGQNMVDARAREAAADARDRQVSEKPMTEGQSKALLFGSRAQEADKIIGELASADRPGGPVTQPGYIKRAAGAMPLVGGALETLTNWTQSEGQQQVEQAQRDFINAVLRRESGAVIAESEFDNARKQYFPQPGDSEKVINQKRKNRELAIRGILAEVPESRRDIGPAPAQTQQPKNIVVDW